MFVVDISLYIMDIQMIEFDLMERPVILRNHGYAGAVHTVCLVQAFILTHGLFVISRFRMEMYSASYKRTAEDR